MTSQLAPPVAAPAPRRRANSRAAEFLAMMGMAVLAAVALAGCSSEKPEVRPTDGPAAQRAFYFWRTQLALGAAERRALAELKIDRLYVRMFDVTWQDDRVQLVGKLRVEATPGAEQSATATEALPAVPDLPIVPVVFLREEVLRRTSDQERDALAAELWREVQARMALLGGAPRELQLDCDWTERTRDAFFALLRELKQQRGLPLSATIRLHQVKYRERTGVPPVERGMLMFYNMGELSAEPGARSIFDAKAATRYLARIGEYPLPLDVALPIWSWTLHVRDGQVIDVLQSTDPAELEGVPFLERRTGGRDDGRTGGRDDGRYVVREDSAFFRGVLLRRGDELAGEVTGPAEAAAAAALLAPHLTPIAKGGTPRTAALFDLSERNLARHGATSLEQLYQSIR